MPTYAADFNGESPMQRFLLLLAMTLFLACAAAQAAAPLYRGPYLQKATPDTVVVVWRVDAETTPVLRYGTSPDALTSEVRGEAIALRVSVDVDAPADVPRLYTESPEEAAKRKKTDEEPSTAPDTRQYEAQVTGLQPATKYYYGVYNGDSLVAGGDGEHYFVTHPPLGSASSMRLWVVGDSGTGDQNQADVHTAMRNYIAKTGRPLDHYLHVGDMAYGDGTDGQFQKNFFAPYDATLRNTVCWPSMGNHEGASSRGLSGTGPYYDAYVVPTAAEAGGVASGTEAYYSFDIADAHFICLDSHDLDRSPDAAMAQWLRADLEQAKAKWLIAYWHHPPYTLGSHDSNKEQQLIEMRENFMPILESAGVDLVLTGHSHIYERSMLIDGAYHTPTVAENVVLDDGDGNPEGDGAYRKSEGLHPNEGHVSVVTGNGGASMSRRGTMPVMREIIVEYGSVIVDIDGDTLKGIMLNKDGVTRDLFSIVKEGTVTPQRIEKPWQPEHDLSKITRHTLTFMEDAEGAAPANWRIAQGDQAGLAVALGDNGKTKILRAKAEKGTLVGLFEGLKPAAYRHETLLRIPAEGGPVGLVFSYVDEKNYGLFIADAKAGTARASVVRDGKETLLEERKVAVETGKWVPMELTALDGKIEFVFGEALEFTVTPDAPLSAGQLGFFVPEGGSAEFMSFQIRL
jgi:hypothetical protein